MKTIRNGVFETNSSSTHSLTMCLESDITSWINEQLYFSKYGNCFVDREKVMEYYKKDMDEGEIDKDVSFDDYRTDSDGDIYLTYDEFFNDYDLMEYETFKEEFTTPSGDVVVSIGYYGSDY